MKLFFFSSLFLLTAYLFYFRKKNKTEDLLKLLDEQQRGFIQNLHEIAIPIFANFIIEVEKKTGYKVLIQSAYRSFSKQAALYAQNSLNARPGYSAHNYGLAIDINLKKENSTIRKADSLTTWKNTGIVEIANKYNLRWGGDFSSYHDPVHFDMFPIIKNKYGLDSNKLYTLALQQYSSIESAEGNKIKFS